MGIQFLWHRSLATRSASRLVTVYATAALVGLWTSALRADEAASPAVNPGPSSVEASSTSTTSDAMKTALDDLKAEMEIGRNMAGRLIAFYGLVEDKQLTAYVNQVGNYVAKVGDYPNRKYMFAILNSDSVNAFACPGGYILVTKGSIKHAKNEAELAAVLGHEAAHVGHQHMFDTLRRMSQEEADKMKTEQDNLRLKDEYAITRRRPIPSESGSGAALARFLMTANGAGLSVLQAAKAGMNMILEKGLDQKLEFEADREGVKYAVRAGYEPRGLDQFLLRLQQQKKKDSDKQEKSVMDKTHPSIPDRRKAIAEELNKLDASQITGAVLQGRFEGFQSRLMKKRKKEQGT